MCGGLVGVGTELDPSLTKADRLTGSVVGKPGTLPPTWKELELEVHLFERVVGTRELARVEEVKVGEVLLLDVGTAATSGRVDSVGKESVRLKLGRPVCAERGARAAISRKISNRWRLIGYGVVV